MAPLLHVYIEYIYKQKLTKIVEMDLALTLTRNLFKEGYVLRFSEKDFHHSIHPKIQNCKHPLI